ncbi:hypothetical protein L915_05994 [Phytophthora nicotianae]|uniref:Uncharacterized protein n=1 Tax=Phytophthora nicotianae TaxID=4792 RepID=W2JAY4_PHYNI|nr:hypothetical protein L915_05994 [Phytophthora nicotianae]ETL43585.1 hypothetical protein L916_05928 [Phytophthora nicotianae]
MASKNAEVTGANDWKTARKSQEGFDDDDERLASDDEGDEYEKGEVQIEVESAVWQFSSGIENL